jgi:hypothetical protein
MGENRVAGIALIAGALAGVVTMAFHPTGLDLLQPGEQAARAAWRGAAVHWLALGSVPLLVLGFLGVSRRLCLRRSEVSAAFIVYALASVAVMCAAVLSGLVATPLTRQVLAAEPPDRPVLHALLAYTGRLNQGFATVFVAGSSVAMILWSVSILRTRLLTGVAGTLGCVIGSVTLVGLASGHLRLNVHGFGAVVAAQSAWAVLLGILLCRTGNPAPAE